MINDEFADLLVTTFNDPAQNPVHLLFNQWWQHAPAEVKDRYVETFLDDPELADFIAEGHYADPLDLDELAALPAGTLGHAYHDWIVDNGLTAQIAMDYHKFHEHLEGTGQLDGMPEEMRYAVLRGFQTHDFQHVVAGFDSSSRGEIGLQAFCLAQLAFPYFGMWVSVVTARMTFVDPRMITPIMDAVSAGWQYGRRTPNIQCQKFEEMLDRPLEQVRSDLGVVPDGTQTAPSA